MRTELEARPLLVLFAGLVAGLTTPLSAWGALGFVALVVWMRPWEVKRLLALAGAVGLVLAPRTMPVPVLERAYFEGDVEVATVPRLFPDGTACEVVAGADRYALWLNGAPALSLGDRLSVRGVVRPLPDGSDAYWGGRGVRGRLQTSTWRRAETRGGLFAWGVAWRQAFVSLCASTLEPRAATVVDAVCFNVDGALDMDTREALQRSGTTHIVSASGLHVLIFALFLQALLVALPVPRWAQMALLALVLVLYAAATGFRPPVVRAVAMASVFAVAYGLRREPDALSALACAGAVYLVASPRSVLDVGFQLSFATVAGLALFMRARAPAKGLWGKGCGAVADVARGSLVATLVSGPLVAQTFGILSLASIPANVLIAFALPPLMGGAMVAMGVSGVAPALAQGIMLVVVQPLAGWLLWVVETVGAWPASAVEVPPIATGWLVAYYLCWAAVWRKVPRPPVVVP